MKRRDLLCCRSSGGQCVATLSCERLYMAYADCREVGESPPNERPDEADWWTAEPVRQVQLAGVEQLFRNLAGELAGAGVLVLEDRAWLQDNEFKRHVDGLVTAVRQRGGEVRLATGESGKFHIDEVTQQS